MSISLISEYVAIPLKRCLGTFIVGLGEVLSDLSKSTRGGVNRS